MAEQELNRNKELLKMIQEHNPGFHPIMVLADIASDPAEESNTRVSAAKGMLPYLEPQLKAIEVKGNMKTDFGVLRVSIMEEEDDGVEESEE
jgi:hypothetical protein